MALRATLCGLLFGALYALTACSTYEERMAKIHIAYETGDYGLCDTELRELQDGDEGNRLLYLLERGALQLALGRAAEGERLLLEASRGLEAEDGNGFAEWTKAALLDDRQLDYTGEDYEKILLRVLLTLASVVGDGRDADAYANSVLEKQREIMDSFTDEEGNKPKEQYKLVAMGAYIRAILAEESPLRLDVAQREFEQVAELEPEFAFLEEDLERVRRGKHSAKGNGVVHVLALVGRGPYKIEVEEETTAAALGIAQLIWGIYRDRVTFPTISSIKIPALAFHTDNPDSVELLLDGAPSGQTAIVTDVEETADQHFASMREYVIARAIVRRVFKIVATETTREVVDQTVYRGRGYGSLSHDSDVGRTFFHLGLSILGAIWSGSERADTRGWSLLPASFQVLRIELPAGEHELELRALGPGSGVGAVARLPVLVRDGFNTYVVAVAPTPHQVPSLLTSEPVEPLNNESDSTSEW